MQLYAAHQLFKNSPRLHARLLAMSEGVFSDFTNKQISPVLLYSLVISARLCLSPCGSKKQEDTTWQLLSPWLSPISASVIIRQSFSVKLIVSERLTEF